MAAPAKREMMREIVVAKSVSPPWKEIVVNTGASASTLQDIKVPDSCGGYTFRNSGQPGSPVSNRFIHWRTCGDILELEETSLDLMLTGARIRYRLQDTPVVGGVSVSETNSHVIVLAATVASIHRLVFPHPCRRAQDTFALSEHISTSIFYDASLSTATDARNLHMLNPGGSITAQLLSAASCLSQEGEAIFALGTNTGSVLLLKMPPVGVTGVVIQHELSQSSVMQKLWSGLVPGVIRGNQPSSDTVISLEIQSLRGETYIFALCRDLRLRVWATKTRENVLSVNLLDYLGDVSQSPPSSSGHLIKQVQSASMMSMMLCVYMAFPDRSQFVLLEPAIRDGRLYFHQHAALVQPAEDLIDFCVAGEQLITLWTDSNGETIARTAVVSGEAPAGEWRELLLEQADSSEPLIPSNRDPRDFFLDLVFRPNEFSHHDIIRALSVYRRSHDTTQSADTLLMSVNLQDEVISAVCLEIRNCASEYEMGEEEFYQLQLEQWGRFYSCCCQYREVGAKLQGVFTDSITGLVCLIRKAKLTFLRPCDLLERLYLFKQERLTPKDLEEVNVSVDNVYSVCEDMHKICEVLRVIQAEISEELAEQFVLELEMMESPQALCERLVDTVFFEDVDILSEVGSQLDLRLQMIHNLIPCLELFLPLFSVEDSAPHHSMMDDSGADAAQQLSCSHLFTSSEAASILCRAFEQMCHTRISFLRDLVLLQVFFLRMAKQKDMGQGGSHSIEVELLPNYTNLVRSYVVLYWSSRVLTVASPTSALDSNMRRLASLELSEIGGFAATRQASSLTTVLESFIQGVGGSQARQKMATMIDAESQATWSNHLMAFVHSLSTLVWPLSEETVFPEFLAGSCQYRALQEYVRLLRAWCTWNDVTTLFFLGLSYLYFDEPHKAYQCFDNASEGVATETFLSHKLLQGAEGSHRQLTVLYYLKVIGQFQQYGMPDMVISLAQKAIRLADPDDPNLATLQSKVFKHQLELGHNQEAFSSMMANPDESRRKDCLRQLIVVLSERGQLQPLVHFPYNHLEDEVVQVLESRARSVDLTTHNYYNLLYSFYVYRNNLRKAASVMYEQGLRMGREMGGVRGLQRQAQCYLVALNLLRLVKDQYAWILAPPPQHMETSINERGNTPSSEQPSKGKPKVEIVELKRLEKDYLLLDARLRLIRRNPDPSLASGPTPGADEMVGMLVNNGLFDMALVLCQTFRLQLHTVFTCLSLKCVNLARSGSYFMLGDNNDTAEAWDWLRENDIRSSTQSRDSSATDHAWKLLQRYLESFEECDGRYHRCVCEKLLSEGFPLPAWLVNSYKVWSAPQLLRVYLDYDQLQPAALLLMEYLEALMGVLQGVESPIFGLKGMSHHSLMSVWVPYTCVDQLVGALQQHREDHVHAQLQQAVREKITLYHEKVSQLSAAAY